MKNLRSVLLIISVFISLVINISAQQINIPAIEKMPGLPSPFNMVNWHDLATQYDSFVFNADTSGQYLPLIWFNENPINYPQHKSFGLHTVVGTTSPGSAEAINVLPAVIGASLNGIDKSNQTSNNYVLMCEEFFNKKNGQNIYLNHASSSSGDDWWYETMPNIFFYQLYSLYSGTGDFNHQFISVADRWLQAVNAMGGKTTPWKIPFMNYRAFNFSTLKGLSSGITEPEAAGAVSWILYNAYKETKDEKYRVGAELSMEFLNSLNFNPSYEIQMPYGAYIAAKMNAIEGTDYDIQKLVGWCFSNYQNRNWGVVSGNWGGNDVYGLIGEVNGSNDYAFLMNTFQQAAALVPLVRYDDRFARAIGKWMLNAANAARLFYPKYLPDLKQDSEEWSHIYDPSSVIAHEALRQSNFGVSPYATGDAIAGGWGKTNLSLYSSSHVGYFGGIIDSTNVPGILKLDLLKTDFFGENAYPSYLFYNPYASQKNVILTIENSPADVYDAISNQVVASGESGQISISVPPDGVLLAVIIPSGSSIHTEMNRTYANGRVIDFNAGISVPDYPPRIKSLSADRTNILKNDSVKVYCNAADKDGDSINYSWDTNQGNISGNGNSVNWIAPDKEGTYQIRCIINDSKGSSDTAFLNITVSSIQNSSPVINKISALPRKIDINSITHLICSASDAEGDSLTFHWSSDYGSFSETDSTALWYSPSSQGNYFLQCKVTDTKGGTDEDSILVAVRDFSVTQTGNLIAFFPFNGNANDESGNALNGITSGVLTANDRFGNINSAFSFDGVDDNIRVPNSSRLNFTKGITVNFWIRPSTFFEREQYPLSHGNWENRWKISITNKRIRWTVKSQTGIKDLDSETELQLNKYYNVCTVYDGSDFEIYINGNLDAITSFSGSIAQTTYDLLIGQVLPGNKQYNFKGIIDDIRIYDYALPFSEIQKLYDTNTDVTENKSNEPDYELFRNYPNPFNSETKITFYIKSPEDLQLGIYNVLGQKIRDLYHSFADAGHFTFYWDGTNDFHAPVSSGIYFCVLKSGSIEKQIKLMLLK